MQSIVYIESSETEVDPNVRKIVSKLRQMPEEARGKIKGITPASGLENIEQEL